MTRTSAAVAAVAQGLQALPEEHRSVLLLGRAGHSYAEIAERLGLSVAHVRTVALHAVLALTQVRLGAEPAQAATSAGS